MAYSSYKIAFKFVLSHRCALFGDAGMFSPTHRLLGAGVKGHCFVTSSRKVDGLQEYWIIIMGFAKEH